MIKKATAVTTFISAVSLLFLMTSTTPASVGPLGVLVFFVFMYLAALGALAFLFHGLASVLQRSRFSAVYLGGSAKFSDSYYRASVVAAAPVMVVALQSVSSVGPYQVLLVVGFVVVGWVYVSRRTK